MRPKALRQLNVRSYNYGACSGDGHWSKTKNQGCIESINPATEKIIAQVYCASQSDYNTLMAQATEVSCALRTRPAPQRGELIRQLGGLLRIHKEALGTLVAMETGKSLQEGLGEVQEMIDMAEFAVGQSRMLYGNTMHSERKAHRLYEQWHPLGVIGVITAFNFPVAVWAWNAFLAVICGNTVIWKPSSKTPLCAIAIQNLCNKVMQENSLPGVFNLFITDKREHSNAILEDKGIALVAFTGSSKVGQRVYETVAKRMGRVLLECSGNNAVIVDPSANLELALNAIVFGAVGTAGQRCTTTRRLFVHRTIYNKFIEQLITAYKSIPLGDPLNPQNLMGPLIDARAAKQFVRAVKEAKQAGGKVLAGGKQLGKKGFFVEPTLIAADNSWPIVQHETFAPILYVMKYDSLEDAIALQNSVRQGLSSALFTQDLRAAELFLSSQGSDCGLANINLGTSGAEIGGAFGGEKETGGGREAGSDAWKAYMRRQTNTINWGHELPLAQGIQFNLTGKQSP